MFEMIRVDTLSSREAERLVLASYDRVSRHVVKAALKRVDRKVLETWSIHDLLSAMVPRALHELVLEELKIR